MKSQYAVRRFEGTDDNSWAVFLYEDVKCLYGLVRVEHAMPIICGMTRVVAHAQRSLLEKESQNVNRVQEQSPDREVAERLEPRQATVQSLAVQYEQLATVA